MQNADAAGIVYVESVGGPENSAPPAIPTPSNPPSQGLPGSSRTRPVDLTGYGATARVHARIFGDLPPRFNVDTAMRRQMEVAQRQVEAGYVPPCPVDFGAPRYLAGSYYLVLFEHDEAGWSTYEMANYRLVGNQLLAERETEGEKHVSPLALMRPAFLRFFDGLRASLLYTDTTAALDEQVWRLEGRVPLQPVVDALTALRGTPSIRPPTTGDAGLAAE